MALRADLKTVQRANALVRQFIRDRGLVLYGGQAIDYALRHELSQGDGGGIYPPGQLPDYDFFSSQPAEDAYDLVELLRAEGLPHVSAVRRMHPQTMGVRVDFADVADISWAPGVEAMTTIEFDGIRVLHPDLQRIDIHLALTFPLLATGTGPDNWALTEAALHRNHKDIERLGLLSEAYPIDGKFQQRPRTSTLSLELSPELPDGEPFVVGGLLAAAALLGRARAGSMALTQEDRTLTIAGCPDEWANTDFFVYRAVPPPARPHTHRPLMDQRPAFWDAGKEHASEAFIPGRRLMTVKVDGVGAPVAAPHAVLLFLLDELRREGCSPARREMLRGVYALVLPLAARPWGLGEEPFGAPEDATSTQLELWREGLGGKPVEGLPANMGDGRDRPTHGMDEDGRFMYGEHFTADGGKMDASA